MIDPFHEKYQGFLAISRCSGKLNNSVPSGGNATWCDRGFSEESDLAILRTIKCAVSGCFLGLY